MSPDRIYGERWRVTENVGEGGQAHAFVVTDEPNEVDGSAVLKRLKNLDRIHRLQQETRKP